MRFAVAVSLLLLSPIAFAQGPKPYARLTVRITESYVNRNNVRIIEAVVANETKATHFMFSCNEDACNAPQAEGIYRLIAPPFRAFKCDEYALQSVRDSTEEIRACLSGVH